MLANNIFHTDKNDFCAGTISRCGWSEQQLLLKSSASQVDLHVHAFPAPSPVNDRHNGLLSSPLPRSKPITADEGVAVNIDQHQTMTVCSVEVEHCSSADSEFSNERPLNITDEISPVASPHTNSEQVIRQEMTTPQCSKLCTGLQSLPLPPTYLSVYNSHPVNHCLVHLPTLQYRNYSGRQLEVPQALTNEVKSSEESCYNVDMQRGPLYYKSHYASKTFCTCSIQETYLRPGNQELVLSHSITFYQSSHRYKSTHYTHTEYSALQGPELYIKPFIALVPEWLYYVSFSNHNLLVWVLWFYSYEVGGVGILCSVLIILNLDKRWQKSRPIALYIIVRVSVKNLWTIYPFLTYFMEISWYSDILEFSILTINDDSVYCAVTYNYIVLRSQDQYAVLEDLY